MVKLRSFIMICIAATALLWPAQVSAAPLHSARYQDQVVHTVQQGENLFRISLRYGTTVDAIMAANGLRDSSTVYAGQRLVISQAASASPPATVPSASSGSYTVQRGDTLSRIARRHGVTLDAIMQANGIASANTIFVGQQLVIPGAITPGRAPTLPMGGAYVVQAGDTLSKIAELFETTAIALAQLNGIANPAAIYAGQAIRLSAAVPPLATGGGKRIEVNLSEQHLYAYEGQRLVYSFVASSGAAPSYTRTGEFRVQSKVLNAYGSAWDLWMPHWMGIYWAGSTENGIHALPILSNGQVLWEGYLGNPVSYGCIVLGTLEAQLLYNWADMGTPVSIHY